MTSAICCETCWISFRSLPKHFHADLSAHAGGQHVHAVDDRLRPDVGPAGHVDGGVQFVVQALGGFLPEEQSRGEIIAQSFFQSRQLIAGCAVGRADPSFSSSAMFARSVSHDFAGVQRRRLGRSSSQFSVFIRANQSLWRRFSISLQQAAEKRFRRLAQQIAHIGDEAAGKRPVST